jgi:hypothetical protein
VSYRISAAGAKQGVEAGLPSAFTRRLSLPVLAQLCYTTNTMEMLFNALAFPFRLVGKLVDVIGRVIVLAIGFVMMVLGIALAIAPVFRIVGIPLFIVGLLLVLRALA